MDRNGGLSGDQLWQQATKTLATKAGWFSGTSKGEIREKAAEQYGAAANRYTIEQNPKRAAEASLKAAEVYGKMREEMSSDELSGVEGNSAACNMARSYGQAYSVLKGIDQDAAISALEKSIGCWQNGGNLRQAATKLRELAVVYEEQGNLPKANESYKTAAYYLMQEPNAQNMALKDREKNAELTAILADGDPNGLNESKQLFKGVAQSCMGGPNRFAVKVHLFHWGLVSLSGLDVPTITQDFDEITATDKSFLKEREYALLQNIFEAVKEQDADLLLPHVNAWANMTPLKPFEETMIGRVEDKLRAMEEDFS